MIASLHWWQLAVAVGAFAALLFVVTMIVVVLASFVLPAGTGSGRKEGD